MLAQMLLDFVLPYKYTLKLKKAIFLKKIVFLVHFYYR
ncbi:hypothetical protein CGSHi22121_07505 [Haemophilus influenzae 22.1-21]|uniref:Uncharacterized protein n=1 Tax=Haemophilus influenzae TaxID=727 RepID=A0A2X1PJ44_HAEIF|nr:hypothetical protein CGSHi22121_07505 [Haemophilus influenzae 22.1-21]EDK12120.1 hypothetical protein CGSHiII_07881 [Haemophilus influenzae PittII]SPX41641.1 Uncharacterised protein [Haemophilus influenzae]